MFDQHWKVLGPLGLAALSVVASAQLSSGAKYVKEEETWRKTRAERLQRETGWLAVAGLTWLKEGSNRIGSDPTSDVVLPASEPKLLGVLSMTQGRVSLVTEPGVSFQLNGDERAQSVLKPDVDRVKLKKATFMVIKRGKRTGVRLWDPNAKTRTEFKGLNWYKPDPKYRIVAKYVAYAKPKEISITNVLGDTAPVRSPGYAEFRIDGQLVRLLAEDEGDTYFFNFRDGTTGKTTYPAGRFLDAKKPTGNTIILDFNRAYNPPCAFTAYATCPIAPRANRLKVTIPAGEKTYHAE